MTIGPFRRVLWGTALLLVLVLGAAALRHAPAVGAATPFSALAPVTPGSALATESAARGLDLSQLDPTCDPCTDFAQFADGGWLKANPIPARYPLWGRAFALHDTITARVHTLLEAAAANPAPDARARQVGNYYAACMDTATIDTLGVKPVAAELARAAAVGDAAALPLELAHLHDIGIGPLFELGAEANPAGAAKPEILGLGQAGLSLPDKSYYLDPAKAAIRTAFVDHVTKMFVLAGDDAATSATEATAVLDFETKLATISKAPAELRDPVANTNVMPIAHAQALVAPFDLAAYLAARHIPADGSIDVGQPDYIKALGPLLASTPAATLATVLRWDVLNASAALLAKPFDDENFHFSGTVLSGTPEQRPRWQRCADGVSGALPDSVGAIYDAVYFTPQQRARATAMILNVKATLRDDISTLPWMSASTRAYALQKIDLMGVRVGYPDHLTDYGDIVVQRDTYAANVRSSIVARIRRDLADLGKPFDRVRWSMPSTTVNAFYRSDANDITFYAGIMQAPFFSDTFDDATNYGAMAVIMGHEMTHGFDDGGRHLDAYGALRDWWTPADSAAFNARAACVKNQFDQFVVADGVHANGALEMGEAIADLGGATIAYKAFERAEAGKPRKIIDGFTPEQRFFLGFATFQTEEDRPAFAKQRASSEPHPLGPFRINGTFANMPEFAQAFSCPAGAAMVRDEKTRCKIW
jgi:predicted metalloendopeptidase